MSELVLNAQIDLETAGFLKGLSMAANAVMDFGREAVGGLLDFSDELSNLETETDVATDSLQEFKYAGLDSGLSMEQLGAGVVKMSKSLGAGTDATQAAVKDLGLSFSDLRSSTPEDAFADVTKALAGMTDPMARAAIGAELLGRGFAPLIAVGKDLDAVRAHAVEFGQVLSRDTVANADTLGDAVGRLQASFGSLMMQFGAAVTESPAVHAAVAGITDIIQDLTRFVLANRNELVAWVTGGIVFAANAMVGLVSVIEVALAVLKALADMWTGLVLVGRELVSALMAQAQMMATPWKASQIWDEYKQNALAALDDANAELAKHQGYLDSAVGVTTKVKEAMGGLAKSIESAVGKQLEGAGAAAKHTVALDSSAEAAKRAAEELKKAAAEAAKAKAAFDALSEGGQRDFALKHLFGPEAESGTTDDFIQMKVNAVDYSKVLQGQVGGAVQEVEAEHVKLSDTLAQVADAFKVLGISADSAFGQILGGVAAGASALEGLKKIDLSKGFSFTNIAQGLTGGLQLASAALSVGKGIFGAIKGIFGGKPEWQKIGEEAGRALGTGLSEELAKAVQQTMKDLNVSAAVAGLLHLTDAIEESGRAASTFMPQINDLFYEMAHLSGEAAAQGVEQLGQAFSMLAEEAAAAGDTSSRAMIQMIQQARATGVEVPEITAAVQDGLAKAVSGTGALLKGVALVNPASVDAQAHILAATFWGKVSEDGIIAAALSMGDMVAEWNKKLSAAGLEMSAATAAMLFPINDVMVLASTDMGKALLEGIQGAQDALNGLADSGYMTAGAFAGVGVVAQDAFGQLVANGASTETALQAVAPLLADIQANADKYGLTIDANTQALIDQAQAAGIAFPTDPLQQVVSLLESIAVALGAEIPAAAHTAGSGIAAGAAEGSAGLATLGGEASTVAGDIIGAFEGVGTATEGQLTAMAWQVETAMATTTDSSLGMIASIQDGILALGAGVTVPVSFDTSSMPGAAGPGGDPTSWVKPDISAAGGLATWHLPSDTLIQAHQGEAAFIVPKTDVPSLASLASRPPGVRGRGGRGGGSTTSTTGPIAVNVEAGSVTDPQAVGDMVALALDRKLSAALKRSLREALSE